MKKNAEKKAERMASFYESLKGLIFPSILTLIILGVVIFVSTYKKKTAEEKLPIQMNSLEAEADEYVLENDWLKFVLKTDTTQFTVTDKKTGAVWLSSPTDVNDDPLAMTNAKERLQSTLILTYSDKTGVEQIYNTYKHSIENKIYNVEKGSDYIKVLYSVGHVEKEYIYPPILTEEEYKDIESRITKAQAADLSNYYKKYDAQNPSRTQKKTLEDDLKRYPILNESVCYICSTTIAGGVKTKIEKIFEEAGFTYEEYIETKKRDTELAQSNKPVYNVNLVYRLDGKDLIAEIPLDEIEMPEDKPLYKISVLPNFGAAGTKAAAHLLISTTEKRFRTSIIQLFTDGITLPSEKQRFTRPTPFSVYTERPREIIPSFAS